jgi:glyoxylase-like metal-dependent hydrolase (beta-lactamase superfamily II)
MATTTNDGSGVRVRMFRQGLGDCFLISFPRQGGGRFHFMIDFGVLLGTSDAEVRMKAVARSIAEATGGSADGKTRGRIDVWVGTHEHWDHLSGFVQARAEIEALLDIREVWLAWTEDPAHPLANELRKDRKRKVAHLRAAAARMAGDPGMGAAATAVESVLGFFGDLGAAKDGGSTGDAIPASRPSR